LRLENRKSDRTDEVEIVANRVVKDDRLWPRPPLATICRVIEFSVAKEYWIDLVGVSGNA
jgi:hypothetical protein